MTDTTDTTEAPDAGRAIIDLITPEVQRHVAESAAKLVANNLNYHVQQALNQVVDEHVKEVLVPAIGIELAARHDEIVAAAVDGIIRSVALLGDTLVERASKQLSQSYNVGEVVKKLFGGY